jgi:hypothetical protein
MRIGRATLLALVVVPLAGCANQRRQAAYDAAAGQCREAIPKQIGHYVALQSCLNDAASNAGFRGAAQNLMAATNLDLAAKVDRGEITHEEAKLQSARVAYEISQQQAAARAQQQQIESPMYMQMMQTGLGMMQGH